MTRFVPAAFFASIAFCSASEPQPGTYVVLPTDRPHLSYDAAYRAGRAEATRDVARGYFAVEEFGRLPVWHDDYAKIAQRRFALHIRTVAGCIVDEGIVGHAKGYNEVSEPAIIRHFGRDVRIDAESAAREKWEKTRQK
jgi:hypothetical protein